MAFYNQYFFSFYKQSYSSVKYFRKVYRRTYHKIPILDLYYRNTGTIIPEDEFALLKRRHRGIENLDNNRLLDALKSLEKFNITPQDACKHLHVFCMNPISIDNYGEILKECGFINILPKHIIHYHTLVRSRTISQLKKEGLMKADIKLEETLFNLLKDLPKSQVLLTEFVESSTSILTVRKKVLQKYLVWRLSITDEVFENYCKNYLPLKHKPMCDIQESLSIAENIIGLDMQTIRRNGFIISSDPMNTELILDNVRELSGFDIKEAIRIEPAILKNNFKALIQIRDLLEEYRIPLEAQRRCLKVYCMKPSTVQERLEELVKTNEYNILYTNPRMLSLVIHKKKVQQRLQKIEQEKKQCFSLNLLVSSSNVFKNYISSFGQKVCGRDIGILISSSLNINKLYPNDIMTNVSQTDARKEILKRLRRHKFWLHSALKVIDENIRFLKENFCDEAILDNCQLLLYPVNEIQQYINVLLNIRKEPSHRSTTSTITLDWSSSVNCKQLTDRQVLSIVLYEIEKKFHFSGDGIWPKQDAAPKVENQACL